MKDWGATPHDYKQLLKIRTIGFDARLGRLMMLMGHKEGAKTEGEIAPGQIIAAWNSIVEPIHLGTDEEKELARRMVRDYILVFLARRNGVRKRRMVSNSMKTAELALEHANFFAKIGNYIFPSMEFRIGMPQTRKTSSFCTITMSVSSEEIEAIPCLIRERIENLVKIEPDSDLAKNDS